jgi:chromosome segregation protein
MLIALELAGFKSFADKTRFDFPDGITVVVGPNGSGKSNIVDAIKWVLGTQSAKSLRGDDMADVIFKGSAAGGRKACNAAEATLVLDNRTRLLPVEADEVHVTRRVFRSGESEYLINREPRRLKDIRDIFRGTGVGIDAYSLIEQGKIDRMLQASAKDRRAIFEEAAGISRFKTKKIETDRRLQRVEQSLVRLSDIVEEVYQRLTTLKNQAAKAQQYREMTQRLAALRTQLGMDERRNQQGKLAELQASIVELDKKQATLDGNLQQAARLVEEADHELAQQLERNRGLQQAQQECREKIAGLDSVQGALRERLLELANERELLIARQVALSEKAELTTDEVSLRKAELEGLQAEWSEQSAHLQELEVEKQQVDGKLAERQLIIDQAREEIRQLELKGHQSNSLAAAEQTRLLHLEQQNLAIGAQLLEQQTRMNALEKDKLQRQQAHREFEREVEHIQGAWDEAKLALTTIGQMLADRQESAMQHQARLQGVRERASLLAQLEEQQEGIGRGAKKLLEMAAQEAVAPWNSVKGLVADLIEIDVHLAPLIDVALGAAAETVVLEDGQIIDLIRHGTLNLDGRVSLMRMDRLPSRRSGEKIQLDGLRGVLGRADRLVHVEPEYAALLHYLLGTTWLVDSLSTALDLSHLRGAGLRFVTAACERIDSDGTLSIGALQTALGLVSRRSEMLAAREEGRHLEEVIAADAAETTRLQEETARMAEEVRGREESYRAARQSLTEAVVQLANDARSLEQLRVEHDQLRRDRETIENGIAVAKSAANQAEQASEEAQSEALRVQGSLAEELTALQALQEARRKLREHLTSEKIVLARLEQRLEGLRATLDQLNRDAHERQAAVQEAHANQIALESKTRQTEEQIHQSQQQRSEWEEKITAVSQQLLVFQETTERLQETRRVSGKQLDQLQRQLERNLDQRRAIESDLEQTRLRIDELVQRYLEDYTIDLNDPELNQQTPSLENRPAAESEIARLRQDMAAVGSVNMEALQELDELQSRYDTLHGHYQDLSDAKQNLLKIIERIDVDSQRLFAETLEAIRQNFQELYRRSFGGGHADLVLEQCEDMSEAGVEIVATPPGKTAFSNSLLSGGEKALTAVALIMAIFKFRPSPFCILDEVDAPFDEANIGRFVSVLTEFLHMTKFVVVSHSKKTMTAANTIYGITMQENGVSRQVAVRFEELEADSEFLDSLSPAKKAA